MNTTSLSEQEIQHLFSFVKGKYVRYIDLQHEIVDHLATQIEQEMSADKKLTFKEALQKVYAEFPITGFSNWVASEEKALYRYWLRKSLRFYLGYFKLPKIVILAALSVIIFNAIRYIPYGQFMIAALLISSAIGSIIYQKKHGFSLNHEKMQEALVTRAYLDSCSTFFILFPQIGFHIIQFGANVSTIGLLIASVLIALTFISTYAIAVVFPKMLEEELNRKYHHLQLI